MKITGIAYKIDSVRRKVYQLSRSRGVHRHRMKPHPRNGHLFSKAATLLHTVHESQDQLLKTEVSKIRRPPAAPTFQACLFPLFVTDLELMSEIHGCECGRNITKDAAIIALCPQVNPKVFLKFAFCCFKVHIVLRLKITYVPGRW